MSGFLPTVGEKVIYIASANRSTPDHLAQLEAIMGCIY